MARKALVEDRLIGQRLKRLREARGLSKEEAAVRCRWTKENLEYYEGGRNKVRVNQLEHWADVYRIPVADLALYLSGCARLIERTDGLRLGGDSS